MSGRIAVDRSGGKHVVRLAIESRGNGNAMTAPMAHEFCDELTALERDDDVKVVIIAGAGADLSCGVDVGEIAKRFRSAGEQGHKAPLSQRERFRDANLWWGRDGLFARVLFSPKITIVAAQGRCHGVGMHLALFADLTIASNTASFAMPQWRHAGVNGDISMLVAAVGLKRAKEFIYCDAEWDADTALANGLVDGVTPAAQHDAAIEELAQCCAMIMRDAVAAEKQVVRAALARMQIETGLGAAAVVAGWGSNIHFRAGEFNLLREAKHAGMGAALNAARDYFSD